MKNALIILITLLFVTAASAQVKFGIRGGLSSTELKPSSFRVDDEQGIEAFSIAVKEANYGYHLGVFLQAGNDKFFIQPEILFNSTSTDYSFRESVGSGLETIVNETYQRVDIPVMVGIKFGILRLQGGPVGHFHLDSSSDFNDPTILNLEGYEQNFKTLTYGYQAGVGLDFWKFVIDVKYEGNFSKYGEHFTFFGNDYSFDNRPGRIVGSVGIAF